MASVTYLQFLIRVRLSSILPELLLLVLLVHFQLKKKISPPVTMNCDPYDLDVRE